MLFFFGEIMNKPNTEKTENKKVWIDIPTFYKDRKCGSGLTFSGKYVVRK